MLLSLPETLFPHPPTPSLAASNLSDTQSKGGPFCTPLHLDFFIARGVKSNCSQFSLFIAAMFYKVAMDMKLANTEPLLPGKNLKLGFWEPLVIFSSTDQYLTLCYVCFYLKTPNLIYTVDLIILNSQPKS